MKFVTLDDVYEPAEDSYLLGRFVKGVTGRVLDVGTGCGIQAIIASETAEEVIGIDINPKAVENAELNARLFKRLNCRFFISDLFQNVEGRFDLIVFNAPYLPTAEGEKTKGVLDKAWNGGKDGRLVIDSFLEKVDNYLLSGGKLLMLQNDLADISKTAGKLAEKKFEVKIIGREKYVFEELVVIEAKKLV